MFIELRIKRSFHFAAVFFLQRQRCFVPQSCNVPAAAPVFSFFLCAAGHSDPRD